MQALLLAVPVVVTAAVVAGALAVAARRTHAALHLESERARTLVDRSTDAIVVLDEQGVVTFANRSAVALAEHPLAGLPVTDLVDPEHRSMILRMVATASSEDPLEFRLADGERWAEATVADLRGDAAVGGVVLALRDVSERRRLTDIVTRTYLTEREAAARSRALEEMRADLLAAVSHDFRTPLTSIIGFGGMLRGHWARFSDDDKVDMVGRILCAAEDLDRRVADFLEISRLEAGPPDLDVAPCGVDDLVTAAVVRMQLSLAGHEVRLDIEPGARALVDEQSTGRVLENLLGNAAKYAPAGTAVTVSAVVEGGTVVLSVSDEGPGIPDEDRDRVFDRFVRLGDRSKVRGAGIGLSVVRQLVEAQGGRVSVEGAATGGATFVVLLPAAVGAEVPV